MPLQERTFTPVVLEGDQVHADRPSSAFMPEWSRSDGHVEVRGVPSFTIKTVRSAMICGNSEYAKLRGILTIPSPSFPHVLQVDHFQQSESLCAQLGIPDPPERIDDVFGCKRASVVELNVWASASRPTRRPSRWVLPIPPGRLQRSSGRRC